MGKEQLIENARDLSKQALQYGFTGDWLKALPITMLLASELGGDIVVAEVSESGSVREIYQPFFGFDQEQKLYKFREYHAALIRPIVIEHCQIGVVDTKILDENMDGVDWKIDYRELEADGEPMTLARSKILSTVEQIFNQLEQLSKTNRKGKGVAELLMTKYFVYSPYEGKVHPHLKDLYYKSRIFYVDGHLGMKKKEAYNILSGRAVRKSYTDSEGNAQIQWFKALQVQPEAVRGENEPFFQGQQRFDDYELSATLNLLPILKKNLGDMMGQLIALWQGEMVTVPMRRNGAVEQMQIWARPEVKSIGILDRKGVRVNIEELLGQGEKSKQRKEQKPGGSKGLGKRKGL